MNDETKAIAQANTPPIRTIWTNQAPPVSQQLPFDARMALVRAAQTPIPPGDPLARVKAIEQAQAMARRRFPEMFQQVKDPEQ